MKKFIRPGTAPGALAWVPLYWFRPEFFTEEGERYRRQAVEALQVMLFTAFLAILAAGLGL